MKSQIELSCLGPPHSTCHSTIWTPSALHSFIHTNKKTKLYSWNIKKQTSPPIGWTIECCWPRVTFLLQKPPSTSSSLSPVGLFTSTNTLSHLALSLPTSGLVKSIHSYTSSPCWDVQEDSSIVRRHVWHTRPLTLPMRLNELLLYIDTVVWIKPTSPSSLLKNSSFSGFGVKASKLWLLYVYA